MSVSRACRYKGMGPRCLCSSQTGDLNIGTLANTLPGTWPHRDWSAQNQYAVTMVGPESVCCDRLRKQVCQQLLSLCVCAHNCLQIGSLFSPACCLDVQQLRNSKATMNEGYADNQTLYPGACCINTRKKMVAVRHRKVNCYFT